MSNDQAPKPSIFDEADFVKKKGLRWDPKELLSKLHNEVEILQLENKMLKEQLDWIENRLEAISDWDFVESILEDYDKTFGYDE